MTPLKIPKKLIEVALPLDDINVAAAREKSIRHGHPSTLHLWWARRPLAAARAVIFAQMVNDPGHQPEIGYGLPKAQAEAKREELFNLIRELVKWENTTNEPLLQRARAAIRESWRETCALNQDHPQAAELFDPNRLPAFHDPFAGGGAIPLEAQRLGLESHASDLNPVAVMINKAMIEIPPKFAGRKPIGPEIPGEKQGDWVEAWSGAKGLAEDVRRYGHWMREQALQRIGHLYPKVAITPAMAENRPDLKPYLGQELTVIAWLWARTVKSPNPAFSHVDVPLVRSFILSKKRGKEVWVETVIDQGSYQFQVQIGKFPKGKMEGTVNRSGATCILSKVAIPFSHIRKEGKEGRLGERLMAMVVEGNKERIYLSPNDDFGGDSQVDSPSWKPEHLLPYNPRDFKTPNYGLLTFGDLFTPRQLVALTTFSDLVLEARSKAIADASTAGMQDDGLGLDAGGTGATAYGDALAVYLSFGVDKLCDYNSSLVAWSPTRDQLKTTFGRQALPMVWDYAETNVFGNAAGDFATTMAGICRAMGYLNSETFGYGLQKDAQYQSVSKGKIVSTDPPYYDNIGYADLSDFFYVWMRRSLELIFPTMFATVAVPKLEELVATPYRHDSKESAEKFFLDGMIQVFQNLASIAHPGFPVSVYYAFKQSETKDSGTSNTGWETFLEAVLQSGFSVTGTWPIRTERGARTIGLGTNALASSIVLVCEQQRSEAPSISRRQFQRELREAMPTALEAMIGGSEGASPIAPVDLAQAAIGPGMGIFSKYSAVLNQDGSRMGVHDALVLINRAITDYLHPDSGNFDSDTLFCDEWFQQFGWSTSDFGTADTLARAKGTSVEGLQQAGVVEAGSGKVRLLKWSEYPAGWDPRNDGRVPVWEACHQMIRVLNQHGETAAGALLVRMPGLGEPLRQLAYHLYTQCERSNRAEDARAYNELIGAWHAIVTASQTRDTSEEQIDMVF